MSFDLEQCPCASIYGTGAGNRKVEQEASANFPFETSIKKSFLKQRFAREMMIMIARAPAQYIANQGTSGPLASCTVGRRGGVFRIDE
jgi:hypothetical protein